VTALDPGDWITLNSNEKQVSHHNGKKSILAINTTLFEFLNTEHTREIHRKRKENIFYINPSFLKLIFSYHSKSLIENQILLNTS
jgi:hypothetical protein